MGGLVGREGRNRCAEQEEGRKELGQGIEKEGSRR